MAKVEQEKNDFHLEALPVGSELKYIKTEVDTIHQNNLSLQKQNANLLNEGCKLKAK